MGDIEPTDSGVKVLTQINLRSIKISALKYFAEHSPRNEVIEIKRTTRAKLSRIPLQPLKNYPSLKLPGSLQELKVRMDKGDKGDKGVAGEDRKYLVSAETTHSHDLETTLYQSDIPAKRKIAGITDTSIFDDIWFIQHCLHAIYDRIGDNDRDSERHVMIPIELWQAIIQIEGIFNGEVEAGGIAALRSQCELLTKKYVLRIKELQIKFKELAGWMGADNPAQQSTDEINNNVVKQFFKFNIADWTISDLSDFKKYLGSEILPTSHNRTFVIDIIKNALVDLFLPSIWIRDDITHDSSQYYPPIELRVNGTGGNEEYRRVRDSLEPVFQAVKSEDKKREGQLKKAIAECKSIEDSCEKGFIPMNLVMCPPAQLDDRILQLIKDYSLIEMMKQELELNFNGLFSEIYPDNNASMTDSPEQKKKVEEFFLALSPIKYNYDLCETDLKRMRELVVDKSSIRDGKDKLQQFDEQISAQRSGIRDERRETKEINDLLIKSKNRLINVESLVSDIEITLMGKSSDESVLWIGLGEAGGRILRECMMYCLNNLADARCTALLRALGVKGDKQNEIETLMKDISMGHPEKRESAEKEMMGIFDKYVHLLAINLGEEIDKLAYNTAPGYFLWGNSPERADSTTRTVRGKRNILKLKDDGGGAGGKTGIGRAFGFRHMGEISDVMKDVGKKGNRMPQHIVITHSLAGGSGSGMVLPVLQQARRTFGQKPIIWVVSAGDGISEKKPAAPINTPFIMSDILQAHYDGIHAISKPLKLSDWSLFDDVIKTEHEQMTKLAKELVQLFEDTNSSEHSEGELYSNLTKYLKGGHKNHYERKKKEIWASIEQIKQTKESVELKSAIIDLKDFGTKFGTEENFDKLIVNETEYIKLLLDVLPNDNPKADGFTKWCKEQERGGNRPAIRMWMEWIKCLLDPLSLYIKGREDDNLLSTDENGERIESYFIAPLTSVHLTSVTKRLYHENQIELAGNDVEYRKISPGMEPLFERINDLINTKIGDEKKASLDEIRIKLNSYGHSLDRFNNSIEEMTSHIQSLSGAGSDPNIKSIIVSNSHLEMGVNSTNHLEVSGAPYTVFNSVIFDLMLNIIGPRLPTEEGVFVNTESEEFDQMDLITSTRPPMVVGLLNQRDSISLSEPSTISKTSSFEPAALIDMMNAMFTLKDVKGNRNRGDLLPNPLFLSSFPLGFKVPILFQSFFGSRYKYMLQINPYKVAGELNIDTTKISVFCNSLIDIWGDEGEVFDLTLNQRNNLAAEYGINALSVTNLIRWLSMIKAESFSMFIGRKNHDEHENILKEIKNNSESLWNLVPLGNENKFELGVLRTDSTIQSYIGRGNTINQSNLFKVLPAIGIHNAEILRSVGPAYLNSFLPLEILFSAEDSSEANAKSAEIKVEVANNIWKYLKENHSLEINGAIEDDGSGAVGSMKKPRLFKSINLLLYKYDIRLELIHDALFLKVHPRLSRYFAAVRDIPVQPKDSMLPSRSVSSSLARYIYADSNNEPLDSHHSPNFRTGIASPTFTMGGQILHQMRYMGLLPDEQKLSLVPFIRILLLGDGGIKEMKDRLSTQATDIGIDLELLTPEIEQILNERYERLEIYNDPNTYCQHAIIIINRIRKLEGLINNLKRNLPKRWNYNDLIGLDELDRIRTNSQLVPSEEDTSKLFGNVDSISELKEWLQDLISLTVRHNSNSNNDTISKTQEADKDVEESQRVTVSKENSTIVAVKQLFYEVSYLMREALAQAEYMIDENVAGKNVHFEMTGFSDRLIGKPEGLLLLVHDRNPKLPMGPIQKSVRDSIEHYLGNLNKSKEYSTAADFGPTSYLTMVLEKAPSANIADQYKALLFNKGTGLKSSDPNWYQEESKLHPYVFLYNILWLSCKIWKWTAMENEEYIRRFQIPTSVIEFHYCNPESIEEQSRDILNDSTSFEGDVSWPSDDIANFNNAIVSKSSGIRNIVPLIGIMALRHEAAGKFEDDKLWEGKDGITSQQYSTLKEICGSEAKKLSKEKYLSDKGKKMIQSKKENPFGDWDESQENEDGQEDEEGQENEDNLKSRTKAWFKAYGGWLKYTATPDKNRNDQANLLES